MNLAPTHARKAVYLVLDTETTGLFDFKLPADGPGQPRLASAAFILADAQGRSIVASKFYVKPDGWDMPAEAGSVNGLTTEFLAAHGVPVADVLTDYAGLIGDGLIVVAFNAQYDTKVMRAELRRAGRDDLFHATPNLCVMRALAPYKADGLAVKGGMVKLSVACEFFGIINTDAHDAMGDAEAARAILERLITDDRLPEAKVHLAKERPEAAA